MLISVSRLHLGVPRAETLRPSGPFVRMPVVACRERARQPAVRAQDRAGGYSASKRGGTLEHDHATHGPASNLDWS